MTHLLHRVAPVLALLLLVLTPSAHAQGGGKSQLENPKLEDGQPGGAVEGWFFHGRTGATAVLDAENAFEGEQCAFIDAANASGDGFCNLSQGLDATPWRGKRLRFRAAVKTAELTSEGRAQLWMRVDLTKDEQGRPRTGSFDNMGDRPIRSWDWKHYEIVLDVADDAERIILGALVIGNGLVWVDDASFEEVTPEEVEATKEKRETTVRRTRPNMDPRVAKALAEAADAPQQSFWTWWLVLPLIAMALFVVGMWPVHRRDPVESEDGAVPAWDLGKVRTYALRFTICYWILYCIPGPFSSALTGMGQFAGWLSGFEWFEFVGDARSYLFEASGWLREAGSESEEWISQLVAEIFFGVEEELVPPNGSGDTTMGYMTILCYFVLSGLFASLWTAFGRSWPSRDASVDLMRTFLRYVLAFAMLGYGLAKVSFAGNQFAELSEWRMQRTWGETSPMGVVWAFMGASRPYTIFAGMGEVVGAALLIWRRTTVLGAIVTIAVMTNVTMLNYCYDVPVKIYSTHLLFMGILILTPDARRMLDLFVRNRNSVDEGTPNFWTGKLAWIRWPLKLLVISTCFLYPMGQRAVDIWDHLTNPAPEEAESSSEEDPEDKHLVRRRGYRWINEVPFNR